MTIGMLVTGSIIRPRIFISTSMFLLHHNAKLHHSLRSFRRPRNWARRASRERHVLAQSVPAPPGGMREVQRAVARSAADPLSERLVAAFHIALLPRADERGVRRIWMARCFSCTMVMRRVFSSSGM
jgi:hypothetical protein